MTIKYDGVEYKKNKTNYEKLVKVIKEKNSGEIGGKDLSILRYIYKTDKRFYVEKTFEGDRPVKHLRILNDDWGDIEPFSIYKNICLVFNTEYRKIYLTKVRKACRDIIAPYIKELKRKYGGYGLDAHHHQYSFNEICIDWLKENKVLKDERKMKKLYDDVINIGDRLTFESVAVKKNWIRFHNSRAKIMLLDKSDHKKLHMKDGKL